MRRFGTRASWLLVGASTLVMMVFATATMAGALSWPPALGKTELDDRGEPAGGHRRPGRGHTGRIRHDGSQLPRRAWGQPGNRNRGRSRPARETEFDSAIHPNRTDSAPVRHDRDRRRNRRGLFRGRDGSWRLRSDGRTQRRFRPLRKPQLRSPRPTSPHHTRSPYGTRGATTSLDDTCRAYDGLAVPVDAPSAGTIAVTANVRLQVFYTSGQSTFTETWIGTAPTVSVPSRDSAPTGCSCLDMLEHPGNISHG